jgi:hypothetical protein
MTLLDYSKHQFLADLNKLPFYFPNAGQTLDFSRPFINENTRFFGSYAWENIKDDLINIEVENHKYLCICLFAMVCADENMYHNYKDNYEIFNRKTNYPKFAYLGFGINFIPPCFLLKKPTELEIDFNSIPEIEIKDFIHYQLTISNHFLNNISPNEFFTAMINDVNFNCECEIFKKIRNSIITALNI